jgi:hypothetical protein
MNSLHIKIVYYASNYVYMFCFMICGVAIYNDQILVGAVFGISGVIINHFKDRYLVREVYGPKS